MTLRPPVADWTSDWDHLDPSWLSDPYPIWRDLRETCPVAHTDRYRGVYFPTRYGDVREIAYDPEHFSSRRVVVREGDYRVNSPPITSDPPDHTWARRILLPAFSPHQIEVMTPITRAVASELLDGFAGLGHQGHDVV